MAEPLVSLETAKDNLQVVTDDDDVLIQQKIQQASDIVRGQMGTLGDDAWTDEDVPTPVQAAVLVLLTHLYENRGDDMTKDADVFSAVDRVLTESGYRDPALA